MPSAWHNFVEPSLRAVRPILRPVETTGLFKRVRRLIRRWRQQHSGQPPLAGAPKVVGLAQLKPVFDLRSSNVESGGTKDTWIATGKDPQFVADCRIRSGWAFLKLELETDVPARVELYIDTGHGFNPRERYELGEMQRRVSLDGFIRLPLRIRQVRLDPLDRNGTISLKTFEVRHAGSFIFWNQSLASWYRRLAKPNTWLMPIGYALHRLVNGEAGDLLQEIQDTMVVARLSESMAYARWRTHRSLNRVRRQKIAKKIRSLKNRPTISVLVPVYNPPIPYLRRCLDSVRRQLYPHWELCIADDLSPDPAVRRELERYARLDPRIKIVFRKTNGNISAATNSALDLATGQYVALLDNDDEIEPHALALAALMINADPSVDMLYSDEDKVDTAGRHFDPFFKPDWSPEYFLSGMYTCHLGVYRRSLVQQVGRFRSEFDGSQDYDLALRITARTNHVRHIPDVLYHWRTLPTSTAANTDAKPKAYEAARRALATSLKVRGIGAQVEHGQSLGYYRVRFAPTNEPRVSIVIPLPCEKLSQQRSLLMNRCLAKIRLSANYSNLEVITVGEHDQPIDSAKNIASDVSRSWAERANRGVQVASGQVLVFLSPFVEARNKSWLTELLAELQQPAIGVVGAKIYGRNGRLSHVGLVLVEGNVRQPYLDFPEDFPGYNCTNLSRRNWSAVRDTCLAAKRELFDTVGGFDPSFGIQADAAFCLSVRELGQRVVWTPHVEFTDFDRSSEQERPTAPDIQKRFSRRLPTDPYYNANLVGRAPLFRVESHPATLLS